MKILMHAFDTETGIPYGQINLQMQTGKNPAWTQKASILSEFGTEQLELIQTSLKTGNPEYARKTEAVIRFLNEKYPDRVRESLLPNSALSASFSCNMSALKSPHKACCCALPLFMLLGVAASSKEAQGRVCPTAVGSQYLLYTNPQGLLPLYIHPQTGDATTQMVSMGAMGDSYYEYLLKVWIYKGRRKEDDMYRGEPQPHPYQPCSCRSPGQTTAAVP